ncbi:Ig-like domain repeat protein [Microbacterium koreense]|uniref:Ig-like domain repeat protein n=1 Tax=Microbacterium koreense TaxID=323761 RepID=A0ABW2ZP40_9MICO
MSKKHVTAGLATAALVGVPVLGLSIGALVGGPGDAAVAEDRTTSLVASAAEESAPQETTAPVSEEDASGSSDAEGSSGSSGSSGSTGTSSVQEPGDSSDEGSEEEPSEGSDALPPADVTKPVINDSAFGPVRGVQTFELSQVEQNPHRTYVEIQQIVDGKWKKFQGEQFIDTNEFAFTVDTDILSSGVRSQLKVSTWDDAGNHASKTFPVGIDRDRPTTTLVAPVGGLTNAAPLEIRLDAADEQGLDRITANIYQEGSLVRSTSTGVDGDTTATHTASVSLPDGAYVIRYNARDLAGNIAVTEQRAVHIDTVAPGIAVKAGVEPTNGIYNTKPSFKLSDSGAGQVDYVLINGVKKDLTNNTWSDLNAQNYAAVQGTNVIEVFDTAGNSTAFEFVFDSLAPEFVVKDGAVVVDGTYLNVPSFKLVDQGDGQIDYVVVNGTKLDRTDNKWSDLNAQNYNPVQGLNVLELFDTAGNSTVFEFVLDTTPPTITLKTDGAQPHNGIFSDEPSFKLHHPGLGQVDYVLINGVKKDLTNNTWSDLNGQNYSAAQGSNTVEVVDTAGNRSSYTFMFDSLAPQITVKPGAVVAGGTYLNVPSFKLMDQGAGQVDYVVVNGVTMDRANNKWSDLNAQNYSPVQGLNVVTLVDTAGNSTVFEFVLDTTAPTITVKPGADMVDGEYVTEPSFKLHHPGLGQVDYVTVNGVVRDLSNAKWSDLNASAYAAQPGLNTVAVFDTAGNSSSFQFTFAPAAN